MFYSMQDLPLLRPRTHNGFLDMQYDNRYTPFMQRAGLDVISFQIRRGLPKFNSVGITELVVQVQLSLAHLSSRTLPQLSLHNLQALGNAVHLILTIQAPTLLVTRVRVRLGGSEGL